MASTAAGRVITIVNLPTSQIVVESDYQADLCLGGLC